MTDASIPSETTPLVGVIMGSSSDLKYMQSAIDLLTALGVPHEAGVWWRGQSNVELCFQSPCRL